ncbi:MULTISPECIES: ABC transporter ATP-binding protein [Methanosarcina]|jgi:iron complex transport system ATP-binding protein|uniref:ABC transporter ATP-binding protein n=6 Tax=Methanosarcina mazei TaxID=2209 RepID=A0A0F8J9R8_METMZ|nr:MULTISPECIES: ABC transporter ATP-binding protein [Methanosarcina]AKB70618.1 ABC transporter, ATP-binding protein [Methanosarcina mazei C16]AGF96007.1 ABC transporter, ATP-binding protein [Methanosarcina mazei Tuc01]AKB39725.1 ABC transporter, ATP-binding protein [Methanosarcina mazei WWM610]AKB60689.1 ABC transporter, ATP-binding protein [Methanosarcina mazei SarPi]KKF97848.1 molybdenum ABC transporter ATP-binding protein [Methanosarcina mazei]
MTEKLKNAGTENSPALLEMKNVTVVRSGKKILDSVSLSIEKGEHVAIIGPNGSGKSSLIKTLTKEYHPLAGAEGLVLKIMGKETWHVFDLRKLLGIVSGELQQTCCREITVFDVILSGFFSSIGIYYNHKVTPEMEARAEEILEFLEISHLSDRFMHELSTGEARRVLIGRALVHDPQALILDEPANSLDLKAMHSFRESVRKIAGSGKNVILVTHNLQDVIPEISRVVLIKEGKVFRDGNKEKVLTDANLSELFSLQVKVLEKDGYYQAWS